MNNLQRLIRWLEQIEEGQEPSIPYNLHSLVRCLHTTLGTHEAIDSLKRLDSMTSKESTNDPA